MYSIMQPAVNIYIYIGIYIDYIGCTVALILNCQLLASFKHALLNIPNNPMTEGSLTWS